MALEDLGDVVALIINEKSEEDKANHDIKKMVEDQLKEKRLLTWLLLVV